MSNQTNFIQALRFCAGIVRKRPDQIKYAWRFLRSFPGFFGASDINPLKTAEPWLCYSMQSWLKENFVSGMTIFEYGSGGSTIFFAHNSANISSIEHNKEWFEQVSKTLKECDSQTIDLKYIPPEKSDVVKTPVSHRPEYNGYNFRRYVDEISHHPDNQFDLVIVDGRCRVACVARAKSKVKNGGRLILDDGKRDLYDVAVRDLLQQNWKLTIVEGLKAAQLATGVTYIFEKPSELTN